MVNVAFFPQVEVYNGNPYWQTLQTNLSKKGAVFNTTNDQLYLQKGWLLHNRTKVNILHFHHLEHHYAQNEEKASASQMVKFVGKLLLARLLGYRVIWTMHNIAPHDELRPKFITFLAQLSMAHIANAVIVHCGYAGQVLKRMYKRQKRVYTIAHPNFIGIYPNQTNKQKARIHLGLPQKQRIFLFFGSLRPYKGLTNLIDQFHRIPGEELSLLIVGKPWELSFLSDLKERAGKDGRVEIISRFIPNDEVQYYLNACDIVVLPFSGVLTSGSAVLAMSFGRPVLAPAVGCLSELLSRNSGFLYNPSDHDGLYNALLQSLVADLDILGKCAYEQAQLYTWEEMANRTLQAYGVRTAR